MSAPSARPGTRPCRLADLPAVLAITNAVILGHHANFHTEPRQLAELEAEWQADHGAYPWLVALGPGGEVLGFAKAGAYKPRRAYLWTAEVTVYLGAASRGQGLGTRLYAELLAELAARGFHLALAGIALPNEASEALHRRLGFHLAGVLPEVGHKHGRWHDVAQYALRLGEAHDSPGPPG
ncbi:MAG: GNAT family N-acetyltransferase [Planctomycetota bacterium]|nr:GNAT family N-acetyltransferase [Planctomycetota bacterium]